MGEKNAIEHESGGIFREKNVAEHESGGAWETLPGKLAEEQS